METKTNWTALVSAVQKNDSAAINELYNTFRRGLCYTISRTVQYEYVLDVYHDTIKACIMQIQSGQLENPEALPGYLRTIASHLTSHWLKKQIKERNRAENLNGFDIIEKRESMLEAHSFVELRERADAIRISLARLEKKSPVQVEVLRRFYLLEQSPEKIQQDMKLTPDQFRNFKTRGLLAIKGSYGQEAA